MTAKKILVLVSGMVAKPCVDYLLRREENAITVACRTLSTAQNLANGRSRVTAISLDVTSPDLKDAISKHDLVISLVPCARHANIARLAIESRTQVVTTSYVSPAIRELDGLAKEAGITMLNEVGVDPGVDHCYAVKVIGEVHEKGGKIREFYSYCGGLPAREASDNPLGLKFLRSPRGTLLSQNNAAIFLKDGKVVHIPSDELMASAVPYYVVDGYPFRAYPNRNSVPFRKYYQIPEAQTVIGGSLRYDGNPQIVRALINLEWLDPDAKEWLSPDLTWAQIQQKATSANSSSEIDLLAKVDELCHFQNSVDRRMVISGLHWIGVLSNTAAPVRGSPLDTLSAHLAEVCRFQADERDLVMLQHKFVVGWPSGKTLSDIVTSTMELFGEPGGYSAMSRSVGITCGVATQLLLDGHPAIAKPGVVAPYMRDICDALRERFEPEGIKLFERVFWTTWRGCRKYD